ncbi:MAG: hypothetical protein KJ928_06685, partial [Candidatus Altiarchaeota archaeon]|nr:hypothetical protein [Candidatus Altiarchaeota archaeon]MBU4437226.1 hypothetical protein [Candidatus Altiarchaeota archaeon]
MADIATGLITGNVIAALAAALGIASTGYFSAKGLEMSGNAAAGVTGEDEENFSAALILEALPQTQVVYGFIISVLIVLGIMSGGMTIEKGIVAMIASMVVGVAGISALLQGKVAVSAILAAAKNPSVKGKVLL